MECETIAYPIHILLLYYLGSVYTLWWVINMI